VGQSAGTIFVMAGDEILMGPASALGPIDPQIKFRRQAVLRRRLLQGLDKIKLEAAQPGMHLNPAYIPILQNISPGEIQNLPQRPRLFHAARQGLACCIQVQVLDQSLRWSPVTPDEKAKRAEEIAKELCDHSKWLTTADPSSWTIW